MLIRSEIFFSGCRLTNKWILCISNSGTTLFKPKKIRNCSSTTLPHEETQLQRFFSQHGARLHAGQIPASSSPLATFADWHSSQLPIQLSRGLARLPGSMQCKKTQQVVLCSRLGSAGYSSRGWQSSAREATSISAHRGVNLSRVSGCSNCFGTAASWILHSCTPVRAWVLGLFPKPGN